jgi:parvulin-like peptidyl-prolyl isomerase
MPRLRSLLAACVAIAVVAPPATAQPDGGRPAPQAFVVDRVVAVINDAVVLASELELRMLPLLADVEEIADPAERRRRLDKLRAQMLDDMVDEELIVQAAAEARIEVEAGDIDAALAEIKQQNNLGDAEFAQALTAQGFTLAGYRADLRRQLLRLKAVNQLVRSRVAVTDSEVRARYDALMRRADSVKAVRLSHVLIRVPDGASDAQLADAKQRAAQVVARVRAGEAFAAVATELSQDEATRAGGGELGWVERGSLPAEWEAIVFAMEQGDVRGPISGPTGLHVFLVSELKRTEVKSFDELKEQIRGELTRREMERQTRTWIEGLRKQAFVDLKP